MPQKRNHDPKVKYLCEGVGTFVPMRIKDILIENSFFMQKASVQNSKKTRYDLRFGKEAGTIIVVNTLLHSKSHFV